MQWLARRKHFAPIPLGGPSTNERPASGQETSTGLWKPNDRMMELVPGDVVLVDLGIPSGSEAGFLRPAVVVSSAGLLRRNLTTIFVIPCTARRRGVASHVELAPDGSNGLERTTWAQCEHLRSVERDRCLELLGNVGVVAIEQMREIVALLIDIR